MQSMKSLDEYMPGETAVADIRRHIDMYNAERPGIYRSCTLTAWLLMGGYCVIVGLILYATLGAMQTSKGDRLFGAVLVFGIAGGAWLWRYVWQPMRDHQLGLRYSLFPNIFGFIEEVRYRAGYEPALLGDLKRLKLVNFTKTKNDDVISGIHEGMTFELVETELLTGNGKNERTTFKGLIFRFRLAEAFPGLLVANKRSGWWERAMKDFWGTEPSNEIASGNLRLDETHEFRSSNFSAAQPVIAARKDAGFTSSSRASRPSTPPKRRTSADARAAPIPATPGISSVGSPASAFQSGSSAGVTPKRSQIAATS